MHYLFFLVTFAYSANAQVILSGSVKGAADEPLIGASILIKNTSSGTTVDVNGNFTLELDDKLKSSTLVISFIGYLTQEVSIGERKTFDIILQEDATQLNEIVVMGYSVQEKGKITGRSQYRRRRVDQQVTIAEYRSGVTGKSPGCCGNPKYRCSG